ncbi:MAG TPA: TonB family protein [Chitinispirillaceae bacterium]|nr:TonB family protein [Chitinispirillaceae bacterium]
MVFMVPEVKRETCREASFGLVLGISVVFHILILVIIPIVTKLLWKPTRFERPKTFQLVSTPLPPAPAKKVPVKKEAPRQRMPVKETKPQPKKLPTEKKITPKKQEAQRKKEAARPIEENLDELASILDEIPAPAQVAAVGDFKYHWYLMNVQQKLERNWNPPRKDDKLKVEVSFTIFTDGSISEPSIRRSSGNSSLDNLAIRAVKLAAPFGKLPPGFSGNKIDLNCTLIPTRK